MSYENLKNRTKRFALDVVIFCAGLPRQSVLSHVRGQLQRCCTSVAANYRAACRSRSTADFVGKLGIVEEEADESVFWLEFIRDLNTERKLSLQESQTQEVNRLWDEGNQLLAIMVSSIKTARSRK